MYVECFKNNGIDYLRLVQSNRVTNSKGIKTARKKVVYNIGPLSKFDDGKPGYVDRLKKSFKAGNPIISSLEKYCDSENIPVVHKFSIAEGSQDCFGTPKIFSIVLRSPSEYIYFSSLSFIMRKIILLIERASKVLMG